MPPTDPRFLAMTEEQIALDFEHMELDLAEAQGRKSETYKDDGYETWEREQGAPRPKPSEDEWIDADEGTE